MVKASEGSTTRPAIQLPEDYDSEYEFLADMREDFYQDVSSDMLNRDAAIEDLQFFVGQQWDDVTRERRNSARKPVLTINRIPAFVSQVTGARRMNETTLEFVPDNSGTIQVAKVREDLVRNIQKQSRADIAYDNALMNQVVCGIGQFQIEVDYSNDDVFEQEINILPILDPLAVVWDRQLVDPTGRDARHCFLIENLTRKQFDKRWPWAQPSDVMTDFAMRGDMRMNGWISVEEVRVVNYWRMQASKRLFALMQDGTTRDITEEADDKATLAQVAQRDDGSPIMREVQKPFAQMYVCSGQDILEGPYNLPISRVPIIRVPGWEVSVGDWRHRWGLVRFMKDPQRLHNYWRSVVAEKLMQTPRGVWAAADTSVQGREAQWRNSHLADDPLLIWNAESGQKPERVPPASVEDSLLGQAEITTQDLKDVTNIHEANLGMPSNEVSSVAIMARQRVSDTGTNIYHDLLAKGIEEGGRIIDELIPVVYDTPRILKVLGSDAQQYSVAVNAFHAGAIDITAGKYQVTATTGTSFATKRFLQAQAMMSLANSMPEILSNCADLIVEAQDWPKAQEIAARLRNALPPGILGPNEQTPQTAAKAQAAQQGAQAQTAAQQATIQANLQKLQSEAALNAARARNFEVTADASGQKLQTEAVSVASQAADRELRGHLETLKAAEGGG